MRRPAAAAVGLASVVGSLVIVGAFFIVLNWPGLLETTDFGFPGYHLLSACMLGALGLAIALRRPANPTGWLLLLSGVLAAIQFAARQYGIYGLITAPGGVPSAWLGPWLEGWIWVPILVCTGIFTLLVFPTGRLLSRRWRLAVWIGVGALALGSLGTSLLPIEPIPGAASPPPAGSDVAEAVYGAGMLLLVAGLILSALSLVVRYRRSRGAERQQLKWLALGALALGLALPTYGVSTAIIGETGNPLEAVLALSILAVPGTIALAMLRYGLYEVDRLINRAVVYGVVSVVLGTSYASSVLVLQPLLQSLTGGGTLAVAGSTLLVATLFQPVRGRVQRAVDRSFFRSRYDGQLMAERLGARLREEVDLDTLGDALIREVTQAMQPSLASVWLRRP